MVKARDLNTRERVMQIVEISACLHHPNVIGIREVLQDESRNKIYCIMDEFCPVSLGELGDMTAFPNWNLILKCIFYQLLLGLEYLHNLGIVHKDLKPANVLISCLGVVKIIDFDVSEKFHHKDKKTMHISQCNSSPIIQAPECLRRQLMNSPSHEENYEIQGESVDIWGFGICLYFCTFGEYPFFSEVSVFDLFRKICQDELHFPWRSCTQQKDESLADLMEKCLEKDPNKRITLQQIKSHDWFVGVPLLLVEGCGQLRKLIEGRTFEDLAAVEGYLQCVSNVRYRKINKVNPFHTKIHRPLDSVSQ